MGDKKRMKILIRNQSCALVKEKQGRPRSLINQGKSLIGKKELKCALFKKNGNLFFVDSADGEHKKTLEKRVL